MSGEYFPRKQLFHPACDNNGIALENSRYSTTATHSSCLAMAKHTSGFKIGKQIVYNQWNILFGTVNSFGFLQN